MMVSDAEWQKVHDAPASERVAAFRLYCGEMIRRKNSGQLSMEKAAYNICGTGPLMLEANRSRNEIVSKILEQACSLELPAQHRSPSSSWEALVELVKRLDD